MNLPARVVDLHTHLFNARYLPLESVIASAMKKDESTLADYVAQLLYALAGSSYADAQDLRADHPLPFTPEDADEHYLEQIWDVVRAGLMERVPADMIAGRSPADLLTSRGTTHLPNRGCRRNSWGSLISWQASTTPPRAGSTRTRCRCTNP